MGFSQYKRRFTAWIACFAVLMAALAPSISYALVVSGKGGVSAAREICTVDGMKMLKADGKSHRSSVPAKDGMHFEHCPFCLTHAASFGLPPSGEIVIPIAMGSLVLPTLFFHAPRPLFAWAAAQPRAPPLRS